MEYFIQQLVNGITLGSIYGLIAIGYTMVYGIIGMINFAHGDIFMIGAFVALISFIIFGLTGVALPIILLLVLLIAMLFTACYGWTVEKLAYKPLRGSFRLAPLISALGMSIVLQNYVQVAQGARVKPMQPLISGGLEFMSPELSTDKDSTQWTVGISTALGEGEISAGVGTNGPIDENAEEVMAYEIKYSYPLNDSVTIDTFGYVAENTGTTQDDSGVGLLTTFKF